MRNPEINVGTIVQLTEDYFDKDDLGLSGIVLGPAPNIYRDDLWIVVGYIENKENMVALTHKIRNKDFIIPDSFLKKISN